MGERRGRRARRVCRCSDLSSSASSCEYGRPRGAEQEQSRLETCGVVMEEILNVEDNIPHDLLDKAECVIVIPQ